jgi:LPS-assembly protein
MFRVVLLSLVLFLTAVPPAQAQQPVAAQPAGTQSALEALVAALNSQQARIEKKSANHLVITGQVDLPIGGGVSIFADEVNFYFDTGQLVAIGGVVFANPEGQIHATRLEFRPADGTATFHEATGLVSLGRTANIAEFGNQDPDIYFWGQRIDKLGPKKYRITAGGFTACVQPTPRWEVTSKTIELNLDDYALARGTILRVKGVPLLYLPAIYYPLQEDQRSTGFLMPTYGTSTLRGASLSNAFFWAIGRSHDATVFHDWFAKAGQGAGGEYRYIANAGSSGQIRYYGFSQRGTEYTTDGRVRTISAGTSHEVQANLVHALAPGLTARGRAEYATDLVSQQLYQQNLYFASNPRRVIEGSVTGAWGAFSTNALYQHSEVFSNTTSSTVSGSTPRVAAAIAPTRLFDLPVYGSLNSEYAVLPHRNVSNGVTTSDASLTRLDIAPSVRVPFSRLTFLTVNSNASYRATYYDRSRDAAGNPSTEPIGRTYFTLRSDVIGPVFNKIWDTPGNATIERMKHVVEPSFTVDYVAGFVSAQRLPSLSHTSDVVVGGTTSVTYGLTNRFMYRGRPTDSSRPSSQEFLTIGVQQTYYSNPEASRWDYRYSGSSNRTRVVDLSPIALTARVSPNATVSANSRLEYDVSGLGLQTLGFGGSVASSATSANVTYSRVVYGPGSLSHTMNITNQTRFLDGRATASYSLSWDLARAYIQSQGVTAKYLAQCCGLTVEYQQYNYPDAIGFPIAADQRLNFGVVLAGLGTFSNFFGAFGGQP